MERPDSRDIEEKRDLTGSMAKRLDFLPKESKVTVAQYPKFILKMFEKSTIYTKQPLLKIVIFRTNKIYCSGSFNIL